MREHLTLPNAITTGNLTSGFLALVVLPESALAAALLIVLAALCDAIDGPIARRSGKDQAFGGGLDSLADAVSFGVAPAMCVQAVYGDSDPAVTLPVSAFFLICGVWRLARFPLVKQSATFVGLPIPVAGLLLAGVTATHPAFALTAPVALALGLLMVSRLPFPTVVSLARGVSAPVRSVPRGWRRGRRVRVLRASSTRQSGPGRGTRRRRVGEWARREIAKARRLGRVARPPRTSGAKQLRWRKLRPRKRRDARR